MPSHLTEGRGRWPEQGESRSIALPDDLPIFRYIRLPVSLPMVVYGDAVDGIGVILPAPFSRWIGGKESTITNSSYAPHF